MSSKTIFVSNIADGISSEALQSLFVSFGEIKSCQVTTAPNNERNAIIIYKDANNAAASLTLDGTKLGDLNISISAIPDNLYQDFETEQNAYQAPLANSDVSQLATQAEVRRLDEVSRTIYVGNLAPIITEEHICSLFSVCGNILYVKMAGEAGTAARYAFIEFSKKDAVQKAYQLTGTVLIDRAIKVGPSNNPIVKATTTTVYNPLPSKQGEMLRRLKAAQDALEKRKREELGWNRSNRSRSPRRRSKSPRRDRRSRSRDRR